MAMTWRNRSLVPRRWLTPAERLLRWLAPRTPGPVQRLVLPALYGWIRRWPLLAQLLGIAPEPSVAASNPPANPAPGGAHAESVMRLRTSDDPAVRARAARDLARVIRPDATAALAAALRDSQAEVAVEAAEALRHHPLEAATKALGEVVENRDGYFSAATRASAVRALGSLLPPGQGAIVAATVADADAAVSLAAIAALVERDDEASAEALLTLLEDASGFYVPLTRRAAARGLLRIRLGPTGRARALLDKEADPDVREALVALRVPAS
jgi:hypothetical protein